MVASLLAPLAWCRDHDMRSPRVAHGYPLLFGF
jgi:hypothetical protein